MLLKGRSARVAVCDPHQGRLKVAREVGADVTCKPAGVNVAIKKLTGGTGFDYAYECTGRPEVWEESVYLLRRGGTLTLFGGTPKGTRVTYDTYRLHYDEITLRGVFHFTPADVKAAYGILKGRKLRTEKLISGSYPLKSLGTALRRLEKGQGVKYAIIP
jgi:L-iditol 2-dehydrogenase